MKKELFQIWKKGVWFRRKPYGSVIACGMVMTAVIFFTAALGDCMNLITVGKEADIVSEHATIQTFLPSYLLFFFLFSISILRYIRIRIFDYEMLSHLGIKPKHKKWFVFYEYMGMFIGSLIGGVLVGILTSEILCKVLEHIFSDVVTNVSYGFSPFKLTFSFIPVLFLYQFVFLDTIRNVFSWDGLLRIGKKGGKEIYHNKQLLIFGVVTLVIGVLSTGTFFGELFPRLPIVIGLFGTFFCMKYATSYLFVKWKKDERKYFKQIVWLDSWYHQFQYHINMTFIMTGFFVIAVSSFMVGVMDCVPLLEKDHYPYDLVWMADDADELFLRELESKYGVVLKEHPSIRITAPDRAEHMGISESEYEKWTGNEISVEEDEVFIVYQRERMEKDQMEIDYGKKKPRFHLGSANEELWLHSNMALGSQAFTNHYNIAGIEDRVLTGVFKNGISEDILVLNDQVFEKAHREAEGSKLTVLMKIPEKYDEVVDAVRAYAKEHSQVDFFSEEGANLIYEKREELLISRERKIMLLTTLLIDLLVLVIANAFAFSEKMYNDEDEIIEKNKFYFLSGMTQKNRRKSIRKEVWTTTTFTILWASAVSWAFVLMKIVLKQLSLKWVLWYIGGVGIGIGVLIVLLMGMTNTAARRMQKRLERGISDGK